MEIQIKTSYRLPTPTIKNIFLKPFNIKDQDYIIIIIKILPNRLHLFYKNILKEIWKFPFDIIDVALVNSSSNHSYSNSKEVNKFDWIITCIVLDDNGNFWRVESHIKGEKSETTFDPLNNQSSTFTSDTTGLNPVTKRMHPIEFYEKDIIYKYTKSNIYYLMPYDISNVHGILTRCENGEMEFLSMNDDYKSLNSNSLNYSINQESVKDQKFKSDSSISLINHDFASLIFGLENLQEEIFLTGYSDGLITFQTPNSVPEALTTLNEPIQAIYSICLKFESTPESSILYFTRRNSDDIHNAFIIVGEEGTITLITIDSASKQDSTIASIAYKEYHVPNTVHSSFLYKNRLIMSVDKGQLISLNFDQVIYKNEQFITLNPDFIDFPNGCVRICCLNEFDDGGILCGIFQDGRFIFGKFTFTDSNINFQNLSSNQLKRQIRKQLNSIAKCSSRQNEYEKFIQNLNSAQIIRNNVLNNLHKIKKKKDDVIVNSNRNNGDDYHFIKVECSPIFLSSLLTSSITNKTFLKIRLKNRLGIDWSKHWSLIVSLKDSKTFNNNSESNELPKEPLQTLTYSISLSDMTSIWEHDVEINLRFLQFPIMINLAKSEYFSLGKFQYDILDFIKPCPEFILEKLKEQNKIYKKGSLDFVPSLEADFCSTRSEFRKNLEKLINENNYIKNGIEKCLSTLLGEYLEEDQLKNIIKSADHAIFITPLSLDPVTINLIELKISCQSPEVIFFVEAAMLTRLNELTIIKSKNDANKGDANMMDIDDKSDKLASQLMEIKINQEMLLSNYCSKSSEMNLTEMTNCAQKIEEQVKELVKTIRSEINECCLREGGNSWINNDTFVEI
ncbi:1938_t:CDS:10 [Entrophospora sp. SA101]|nr:1938_t:CDS:10 [Entrophospora sp. SA101]